MAVTIKEVAALAGVSPSTVSRTCKNNPSISEETKERVRRAMAQLGYEPNFQASNLASQNSRAIGIILPPSEKEAFENPFYLEVIRGISQFCNQRQYINTVITGRDDREILQAIRSMTRSGQADGFIVLYSRQKDPIIDYLYGEGLLFVLIGKAYQFANQTIYIDNDNMLAGQEAADYLWNLGHRRIAYIGSGNSLMFSADRRSGYEAAMLRQGCAPDPGFCGGSLPHRGGLGSHPSALGTGRPPHRRYRQRRYPGSGSRAGVHGNGAFHTGRYLHSLLQQLPLRPSDLPPAHLRGYQFPPAGSRGRSTDDQPHGEPQSDGHQDHCSPPHH